MNTNDPTGLAIAAARRSNGDEVLRAGRALLERQVEVITGGADPS